MASHCHCRLSTLFSVVALLLLRAPLPSSATSSSLVGINYGRLGNNLPPPETVPHLISTIAIGRVRLYDADPTVLRAFANTGIELVVGLPDKCVCKLAADPNEATTWVRSNVQCYLPATKIAVITVGNEVLTSNDTSLAHCLVPAMESLHSALASLSLDHDIAVTTAHSLAVLATPSYPPSVSNFRRELLPYICPLLAFHARTGSPFFVNAYPYFAYDEDPTGVSLDYALLDPHATPINDPSSGLRYANLLHAQVDAVYHAIAGAAPAGVKGVEVRISETGWPSAGDPDEKGATPENAAKYNANLMQLVAAQKGTPLMPGTPIRVYIFALFNENLKVGPASERNYGLFKADGTPAYDLGIVFPQENTTTNGDGHGHGHGGGGGGYPGSGGDGGSYDGSTNGSSSGYYSISAACEEVKRGVAAKVAAAASAGVSLLLLRLML